MTLHEFATILESYGVDENSWPRAERAACQALLAASGEARDLLSEHQQLEHLLAQSVVPEFPGLESRVLHQRLPPRQRSLAERVLDWLIPVNPFGPQVWRPAMAACLPLVFGIVVGNFFSFGVVEDTQGFEYWDDELYMLSLNDYTENLF